MAPKRTFAEAMAATHALSPSRRRQQAREARAQREALAPKPPEAALQAYLATMDTYAQRVSGLVERHVLSRLPVVGSGDPLDSTALTSGLGELQDALTKLAGRSERSARAAARRTERHARGEIGRLMNMVVPPEDLRAVASVDAFIGRNVALLQKVGREQVARIAKAIAEYREGDSMRKDITDALWVSRNRSRTIARDQIWKLHRATLEDWAISTGSQAFVYVTRRDELVRPTHAAHDGKVYTWAQRPSTLDEVNCRCVMLPIEGVPSEATERKRPARRKAT